MLIQLSMQCCFHRMVPNDDLEVIRAASVGVMMMIMAYFPHVFDWNQTCVFVFGVYLILRRQLQYENLNAWRYAIMMNSAVRIYRSNQRTEIITNTIIQSVLFNTYYASKINDIHCLKHIHHRFVDYQNFLSFSDSNEDGQRVIQ